MTYRNRFTLVGIGIVIFMIITPALLLYARGFMIDWGTHQIIKTGAIVVKTDPAGAIIFLNNKAQSNQTPSNLRFLTPGEFDIRIEKDAYQSWTKRLSVKAQLVTKLNLERESIALFYNDPKIQQSWSASETGISKTGDEIIFLNNGQVSSLNTISGEVTSLGNVPSIQIPVLLPDKNNIRWQNGKAIFQTLLSRGKFGLSDAQIGDIRQVEITDTHIAAKIGIDLYSLDNSMPVVLDKNIVDFTLDGDKIWYIQENFVKRFNYDTGITEIITKTAPVAAAARIIRSDNQIYAILDSNLYVLNDDFEKIYDKTAAAFWDPESKQLMFNNNNEILTYDPSDKKTDLILRSSSPIKNPVFNWQAGYIFFENEGKIKAIELDGRDHRNIYNIADLPDDQSSFTVSKGGRELYIFNSSRIDKYNIR